MVDVFLKDKIQKSVNDNKKRSTPVLKKEKKDLLASTHISNYEFDLLRSKAVTL